MKQFATDLHILMCLNFYLILSEPTVSCKLDGVVLTAIFPNDLASLIIAIRGDAIFSSKG
jgi:hypothetical protein